LVVPDKDLPFILRRENTARYEDGCVVLLDRRVYPLEIKFQRCDTPAAVARAISDMVTQGAGPAFAAGFAMAQAARTCKGLSIERSEDILSKAVLELSSARPTNKAPFRMAIRMKKIAISAIESGKDAETACLDHAEYVFDRYFERSKAVGRHAAEVIGQGDILTHCFAEAMLAEVLLSLGKGRRLIVSETRPYFQGARLTAKMALDLGIEVMIIPDSAMGSILLEHDVAALVTAADSVTLDGHVVNKIGTYLAALAAKASQVPYFVLCFGPDQNRAGKEDVEIEQRPENELLEISSRRIAASGASGYLPAFDVTPPELITAYITHRGVFEHPAALAAWGMGTAPRED